MLNGTISYGQKWKGGEQRRLLVFIITTNFIITTFFMANSLKTGPKIEMWDLPTQSLHVSIHQDFEKRRVEKQQEGEGSEKHPRGGRPRSGWMGAQLDAAARLYGSHPAHVLLWGGVGDVYGHKMLQENRRDVSNPQVVLSDPLALESHWKL